MLKNKIKETASPQSSIGMNRPMLSSQNPSGRRRGTRGGTPLKSARILILISGRIRVNSTPNPGGPQSVLRLCWLIRLTRPITWYSRERENEQTTGKSNVSIFSHSTYIPRGLKSLLFNARGDGQRGDSTSTGIRAPLRISNRFCMATSRYSILHIWYPPDYTVSNLTTFVYPKSFVTIPERRLGIWRSFKLHLKRLTGWAKLK